MPPLIQDLLTMNGDEKECKDFRENIRQYNSSLSFASFGAQQVEISNRGPYCFEIQGSIYHLTSNLKPDENSKRQYATLLTPI